MRFLKALTIGMGVLIVVATTVLVVLIVRRLGGPVVAEMPAAVALDEPVGTRIAEIAAVDGRLALRLEGGGADRVVLVDPRTGRTVGRIGLRDGGR